MDCLPMMSAVLLRRVPRVWAGTAQGIAVREAGAWRVVDRRAVDACACLGLGSCLGLGW